MFRNLLISSIRVFRKNLTSSLINFFGLVLSFACASVIGLYLYQELSYDAYHEKANRIFRLTHNEKAGEIPGDRNLPTVGPPVGPALKQSFTAVEDAVRFRYSPDRIIRAGEQQHYENGVYYVDPSVFNVFSLPMQKGDASSALSMPNNVVLTSAMAQKYFGDEDPIGKTLLLDNTVDLKVTGVLEPLPVNTHLKFDFLLPFEAFKVPHGYPVDLNTWGWISFHTYVLLKPGHAASEVEGQLPELVKAHWPEERAKKFKIQLQPLMDIYLGEVKHEQIAAGNTTYLSVLSVAVLLILILAGFNFANLYTAICVTRAKEIGVRKVTGASKKYISWYIVLEAILFSISACILAILFVPLVLRYANGYGFAIEFNGQSDIWMVILLVSIITGCLAALYPASFLSAYDHQKLLKGLFRTSRTGVVVRKTLVLIQFCITIALLSSVFIIESQMRFMETKDLGYVKNELMLLRMPGEQMTNRFQSLKSKLLQHEQIKSVTLGGGRMDGSNGNVPIYVEGNLEEGVPMSIDAASFNFFETIGVKMVAGREITEQQPADTLRGVMINQSAAKAFGWTPEQAIGKKIQVGEIVLDGEVIGVIPDFHFGLLRNEIKPLVMNYPRVYLQDIYIRFNAGVNLNELVDVLKNDWHEIAPEFPFDYVFLNQHLQSQYTSEKFFALLFKLFAIVAILISCLGLFGLVSQDVAFRVKEMGVRKVLGASGRDVAMLIMKPFLLLIVMANIIAWPLSWLGMSNWLAEFSYHTVISPTVFLLAGVATLSVALLTLLYKVWRAGRANPVESLRSE